MPRAQSTGPHGHESKAPSFAADAPRLNVKRMLRLRAPLMITVVLVLAIPSIVLAWLLVPLEYTSTADFHFLSSRPRVMTPDSSRASADSYEKFLNTQISLIMGSAILSRVLDEPSIRTIPLIAEQNAPLAFLKRKVHAVVQRRSELVTIHCTLADRNASKAVLEEVVSEYFDYFRTQEADAGGERLKILRDERDKRQLELDVQIDNLANRQSSLGTSLDGESDLYRENLISAEEELDRGEALVVELRNKLERCKIVQERYRSNPKEPIFEFGIEERVTSDERVVALRLDLVRSDSANAQQAENMVKGSRQLRSRQKQLAILRNSVSDVEAVVRHEVIEYTIATAERLLEETQHQKERAELRVSKFRAYIDDHKKRVEGNASLVANIDALETKVEETRDQLQNLRGEISAVSLESNAPARARLASPPTMPGDPDYGKRLQIMGLALMTSLCAGVGAGALKELNDQHIRSVQDIGQLTRLPVLASIPHGSVDDRLDSSYYPMVCADFPESKSAEEFRRILAWLLYPQDSAEGVKTVMVASPTQGDGRTSVACNVAIALAQTSRRVLLLDLNGRKPDVESSFGMERAPGLANLLRGGETDQVLMRACSVDNLRILGPGTDCEDLVVALSSRDVRGFLERARQNFDHIILDTPPSLLTSDAKLLAPLVDGVILVVGVSVSNLGMVRRSLGELQQVGANMIGVVLNGLRFMRHGYLREDLQLYYDYSTSSDDYSISSGNGQEQRIPPAIEQPILKGIELSQKDNGGDNG